MGDSGWRRLAEYPARYAAGTWETDPVLCPACAPGAGRPWNWERLPYPRSSGVRIAYSHPDHPVPVGAECGGCGARRRPADAV